MQARRSLTREEMDQYARQASDELHHLHPEAIKELANWWDKWYRLAGHRRLGRLLRAQALKTLSSNLEELQQKPTSSATLRPVTISIGMSCEVVAQALDESSFMTVRSKGSVLQIVLNTTHPAYTYLSKILKAQESPCSSKESQAGDLERPDDALLLLLEAWAHFEADEPPGKRREVVQMIRNDWGRAARRLLDGWEDDAGNS
jgi:hypothetical protein